MQYKQIHSIKSIHVLLAGILLSGCQIWPDYLRPKVEMPAEYGIAEIASASEAQVVNQWWTLYQDETLNRLVENTLQNNRDIKQAVAKIEEADAVMREVGTFLLPQINLETVAKRTRVTEAGAFPVFAANPRDNFNFGFATNFELDFWGKLRRSKEAARAQAMASRYAKETVALSLTGLVTSHYLTLRSLDSQIALATENLKSREQSLALTKRRFEGGLVSALDVHQAEVAQTNLAAQVADLQRMRALALNQLALLSGEMNLSIRGIAHQPSGIEQLPIPPVPPAGLPSRLLEARPDIREAEALMVAANANIAVAKAALYPSVSLTANYGGESLELSNLLKTAARVWTGGLSVNLPIFTAGRLDAKVEQATTKQKQVLAGYEGAIQNAFREVNDALVNLRQYSEREQSLDQSRLSAKKALEIAENRYQSGYSSYIDVLDAQRTYNDAGLAYVQGRQLRLIATVDLFKALGGGWQDNFKK